VDLVPSKRCCGEVEDEYGRCALQTVYRDIDLECYAITLKIEQDEKGADVLTWRLHLGQDGEVAHVALDDCGYYIRWLFDHPERATAWISG